LSLHSIIPFKRKDSPRQRFESLMRPHFDPLYAAARRMTLSPIDAEDLVQEVCLKAFTRLDELEAIEYKRAWLLKVLYNKFIDSRRSDQRSPVNLAGTGAESTDPDDVAVSRWQPEEQLDQEIRADRILKAMSYLNKDLCALVALHDIEGMTLEELQKLTGRPIGTIKAQLHRTRIKLGRLLSNDAILRPHLRAVGDKHE
jgi:RNA polymerase sigma-70 factor (ECF subfamily)